MFLPMVVVPPAMSTSRWHRMQVEPAALWATRLRKTPGPGQATLAQFGSIAGAMVFGSVADSGPGLRPMCM